MKINNEIFKQKWIRSNDGIIAGVCSGLAERFDIDPMLVRLGLILSVIFFGFGIFLYLGLAIALPREDKLIEAKKDRILGVCSRISERSQIDVGLVRFACLAVAISSFGATIIAYIILHFVLEDQNQEVIESEYRR